jgi:radical SAM superfamily enzyme YgiQ (UPF0313 family)
MALNILLINPRWNGWGNRKKVKVSEAKVHPLTLGIVAAIIQAHSPEHRVRIVDEATNAIPYGQPYDLVGITVNTFTAPQAFVIADNFRARGIPVLMGGVHATLMPDACLKHADAVLVGEAEEALTQVLDDLENGQMTGKYVAGPLLDMSKIPIPDRSLFTLPGANAAFIQATRGCNNVCRFCYLQYVKWGGYRARPVAKIITELQSIPQEIVLFVDDNMFIDRIWGLELFAAMNELGKHWWAQAPTTLAADLELLQAAADSGCFSLSFGFQTVNASALQRDRILQNRIDKYQAVVQAAHDVGILVDGTFIFGFDSDDSQIFADTVTMIKEMDLDTYTFYMLTVYPGTPYYEEYRRAERLASHNLNDYDWDHASIHPARMTATELEEGVRWAYRELDRHYRRRFLGKALRNAHLLPRSVKLARFLLSSGYPRPYYNNY